MVFLSGDLTVVLRARYPTGRLRTLETGAIRDIPRSVSYGYASRSGDWRDPRTAGLLQVNLRTFGDLTVVLRARSGDRRDQSCPLLSYNCITTHKIRRGYAQHPIPIQARASFSGYS